MNFEAMKVSNLGVVLPLSSRNRLSAFRPKPPLEFLAQYISYQSTIFAQGHNAPQGHRYFF
ncbi:MAG: hypothetical protein ACOH1Q_06550 [Thiobacillus sp.]